MGGAENTSEEGEKVSGQKGRKLRAGPSNPGSVERERMNRGIEGRRKGWRESRSLMVLDLWAHHSHFPEN